MQSQREDELWTTRARKRIAVVGGGIAGLAAAYKLVEESKGQQFPPEIFLLEGSPRLGGCISTYNLDDTVLELGPDSFITDKPAGLDLCKRLGLEDRLIGTAKENRRTFVAREGKLFPVPEGFMMMAPTQMVPLMNSPLFSMNAKLRMMQELFIQPAPEDSDESLTQFVERRLGREALDRLIQPLVGGIYTGDPDKLSVKAALPRIAALEREYGSIIRGLTQTKKKGQGESGARYGLFVTFDEGMSVLVNSITSQLQAARANVHNHSLVSRVRRRDGGGSRPDGEGNGSKSGTHTSASGWDLVMYDGKVLPVDGVVLATSAFHAADILSDINTGLSADLRGIEYASSAVVNMIFRRKDIPHALDGFGFVVPRTENATMMACSFTSVKWPNRAPEGKVLMRVFVGGALQPDIYDLTDEQIECLLWQDMNRYMGLKHLPVLSVISRFPRAMPQYNVGHLARMKRVNEQISKLPGIQLAGNAYTGVGIPDCIASGEAAATAVMTAIGASL